jgi:hypothetical protein
MLLQISIRPPKTMKVLDRFLCWVAETSFIDPMIGAAQHFDEDF